MPASKSSHSGIAPSGGGDLTFHSSHIVVSGDESGKLSSGTHESYQSGDTDNVQAEYPAEIDGNTFVTDTKDDVGDENAPEQIDFAITLMNASRAELSLATLDTVVFILRCVIDERQITPGHPLYISSMNNLASALGFRFIYANQLEDFVDTFSLRRKIIEACNEDQAFTDFIFQAQDDDNTEMAMGFLTEFQKSIPIHIINTVVFLLQRSLPLLPAKCRERFSGLTTLAFGLYNRFYTSNDISDLDDAISNLQDALKWCVDGDLQLERSNTIRQIFCVFAARFDVTKDILDLQKGFSWFMEANIPAASLRRVALSLLARYQQGRQRVDIDVAISLFKRALDTPNDDPSTSLINLGTALLLRFQEESQQTDLDEAISLFRRFFELRIPSDPQEQTIQILRILASALSCRFKLTDQRADIDEAISLYRQCLELPSNPEQLDIRHHLAVALGIRFKHTGQQSDIDEAISLRRQCLELHLPSHPGQRELIRNLATALAARFELTDQRADIDEAISLRRQCLEFHPPSHPERSIMLGDLAHVLSRRFLLTGQNIDIDDAISLQRQAVVLSSSLHPCQPFTLSLNRLAVLLSIRFKLGGQQVDVDVDEAIYLLRQSLETDPNDFTIVHSLATALELRFERKYQQSDIDEAISLYRQLFATLPRSDPESFVPFDGLASSLSKRFELFGQKTDLDESISIYRQGFKTSATLPLLYKSDLFHNFAVALALRYEHEGQQSDFDEAYSLYKEAIDFQTSHDHTSLPGDLTALGRLCILAHSRSGGETSEYLEEAMSSYSAFVQYPQSAFYRLRFAKIWINHAELYEHPSVFNAYEAALQALPQVAALSLDIQSRQEGLADSDGLARNAARCAIRAGNLEKAIEFLEGGRSVFWSQVLSLRSPISKLHDIAPELANKLQDISTALELGSHRDVSRDISNYMQTRNLSIEEESSRMNRMNEEWAISIDNVRRLEGFEDFLRPLRLSALRTAASTSPVVILVANSDSHCLILTSTTIHHIDLPRLHTRMLQNLVRLVQVGVSQSRVSRSSISPIVENINTFLGENRGTKVADNKLGSSDDVFKFVLGILWDDIVNPVIRLLKIQKSESGDLPVLKWCPTGLFNFLPIHAAGHYNDLSDECASDYFISSYTPTIGALLLHNSNSPTSAETFKMMVVIESSELPSTKTELKVIEQHVPSDMLIKVGVAERPAEVEAVASLLPSTSIVHFACHGMQDRSKPLDSGLKLNDGLLRISRIMKETITNKSLAFLCACETAMGDKDVPDEAMSLGASLLFSGFHRVIATMWEIMDADGPTIADGFYENIFRGPDGKPSLEPDITRSAQALHVSVKKLRSKKVSFRRWVPFIHMGQ